MFRLVFLCFVAFSSLFADCGIRTETEGQSSVALKDLGLSQWLWFSCRPDRSRFAYGFNARYLNFLTTHRVELTASSTLYVGKGFINLNPGRTTDGRWTTSVVAGYRWTNRWSVVALADPKWHHRFDLPTTLFQKVWVCRGWLCGRDDRFRVGNNNVYHYLGVEVRVHPVKHLELFFAPQASLIGTTKLVGEFGLRTNFDFLRHKASTKTN